MNTTIISPAVSAEKLKKWNSAILKEFHDLLKISLTLKLRHISFK
jgi:hypothetical protein